MFIRTRLRLTCWYLVIIMSVSSLFSVALYEILGREVERFAFRRASRFSIRDEQAIPSGQPLVLTQTDILLIRELKMRILLNLLIVNGIIFVTSGGLGYFLAGKTLQPIQLMIDEQNRFVSDASHELKTPLTSLRSAFEVYLREEKHSLKESCKLVKESLEEVEKLQVLSESLLMLSRQEEMNNLPHFQSVSLKQIIEKSLHKVRSLAEKKHITVLDTSEPIDFIADSLQIEQLITILIDNAFKYSPTHSTVTLSSTHTDRDVILHIKDQGIGIRKEDIPHLFERFYRADLSRSKEQAEGFGLGLSIAKKIVDMHRGTITVKSKLEKGTTFSVRLPLINS